MRCRGKGLKPKTALRGERGLVLVVSLGILVFLALLGSSFLVRGLHENQLSNRFQTRQRALSLAEASADVALSQLRAGNTADVATAALGSGTYWAQVADPSEDPTLSSLMYRINGHGLQAAEQRDTEVLAQLVPKSVFQYPLFGNDTIELKKGAFTDSYNSSLAPYDPNNPGQKGTIATNATASGSVELKQGTVVNGQVVVGPGLANPSTAVSTDGSTLITGNPPVVSATQALLVSAVDTSGLSCNTDLKLPKNSTFTFDESHGPYCYNKIDADQGSVITVSGNVQVYANQVDFDKNLSVNVTGKPPQFLLYIYGTQDVVIDKDGTFVGAIYAPQAKVKLKKQVDFYGALLGDEITISKESKFHYDEALTTVGPAGSYGVSVVHWRDLN